MSLWWFVFSFLLVPPIVLLAVLFLPILPLSLKLRVLRVVNTKVSFGGREVPVSMVATILSSLLVLVTALQIRRLTHDLQTCTQELMRNSILSRKWREERNLYIGLLCLYGWIFLPICMSLKSRVYQLEAQLATSTGRQPASIPSSQTHSNATVVKED
eukprot:GILJ01002761.1.p1 GENE.GILJ01002761.1~~GILJ01002761.1.p1  ORF type:complete len:185 (+),score=25.98 GILJ01002761.1:84-557(+)